MELRGTTIGHIRIDDLLGEGGVGKVWVGYDQKLERKVALKAIEHADPELKKRLLREARILSQLDHPNICRIHGFLEAGETELLVLEFVEGHNLRALMNEGLDRNRRLEVARQVAGVLVVAHERGVIHRDLKPENVMVTPGGSVKVLDFGLARFLSDELSSLSMAVDVNPFAEPQTRGLYLRGTAAYMSPEQAQGEVATEASDMFAFGVLLQELFTGRLPYPREGPPALLLKVSKAETLAMESGDAELDTLVERLKSLSPAARPTAVDTAARLAHIAERPRRKRRANFRTAGMTMLMATAGALALQSFRVEELRGRIDHERTAAVSQEVTARRVSELLLDVVRTTAASPEVSADVERLLREEVRRAADELAGEPLARARLLDAVGNALRTLRAYGEAELRLREALALRQEILGPDHSDVAVSLVHLADLCREQGRDDEAEELLDKAVRIDPDAVERFRRSAP